MKQRNPRKVFRQLTDLTPRQLQRLQKVLEALKGLRANQAAEILDLAAGVRGMGSR